MRMFLGLLLAPVAPLLVIAPVMALASGDVRNAGPFAFLCVVYGYPVEFGVALPLYRWFRERGRVGLWRVLVAGAVIGAVMPAAILTLLLCVAAALGNAEDLRVAALGAGIVVLDGMLLGAMMGLAFWIIALWTWESPKLPTAR